MKRPCSITVLIILTACLTMGSFVPPYLSEKCAAILVDGLPADYYSAAGDAWVPLFTVSEALGANALVWDPNTGEAIVDAPGLRITAKCGEEYITANGRYLYAPGGVRLEEGRPLVPAEALARAFGARMALCDDGTVDLRTTGEPIEAADYDAEDLKWLSRIIMAEAGGESLAGKIAVGNVVLNRAADDGFPDTVKGVIFDRRFSIQFTPAYNGGINNTPSDECVTAAKLALDGANTAGNSLYFASVYAARYCWAERNRERFGIIDHQVFYV